MKNNYRYPPLVIALFLIAVLLSVLFAVHLASADEPATPEPLPNVREVLARPDSGRVIILVASDTADSSGQYPPYLALVFKVEGETLIVDEWLDGCEYADPCARYDGADNGRLHRFTDWVEDVGSGRPSSVQFTNSSAGLPLGVVYTKIREATAAARFPGIPGGLYYSLEYSDYSGVWSFGLETNYPNGGCIIVWTGEGWELAEVSQTAEHRAVCQPATAVLNGEAVAPAVDAPHLSPLWRELQAIRDFQSSLIRHSLAPVVMGD